MTIFDEPRMCDQHKHLGTLSYATWILHQRFVHGFHASVFDRVFDAVIISLITQEYATRVSM
jgi:hypothetical protein